MRRRTKYPISRLTFAPSTLLDGYYEITDLFGSTANSVIMRLNARAEKWCSGEIPDVLRFELRHKTVQISSEGLKVWQKLLQEHPEKDEGNSDQNSCYDTFFPLAHEYKFQPSSKMVGCQELNSTDYNRPARSICSGLNDIAKQHNRGGRSDDVLHFRSNRGKVFINNKGYQLWLDLLNEIFENQGSNEAQDTALDDIQSYLDCLNNNTHIFDGIKLLHPENESSVILSDSEQIPTKNDGPEFNSSIDLTSSPLPPSSLLVKEMGLEPEKTVEPETIITSITSALDDKTAPIIKKIIPLPHPESESSVILSDSVQIPTKNDGPEFNSSPIDLTSSSLPPSSLLVEEKSLEPEKTVEPETIITSITCALDDKTAPIIKEVGPSSKNKAKRKLESESLDSAAQRKKQKPTQSQLSDKNPRKKKVTLSSKYFSTLEIMQDIFAIPTTLAKSAEYSEIFPFQFLRKNKGTKNKEFSCLTQITNEFSSLRFYSSRTDLPTEDQTVSFIFAGRNENAMVPDLERLGEKQRIILVFNQEEFNTLSQEYLVSELEFLVIESLGCASHGIFEKNSNILARRLAAFIFSYQLKLQDCLYLDDNLKEINTKDLSITNWQSLTTYLKEQRVKHSALVSGFKTLSKKNNQKNKQDYCYKLFALNFQEIVTLFEFQSIDDVFILGYPAKFANYCLEDHYFQMIVDFARWHKKTKTKNDESEPYDKVLNYITPSETAGIIRMSFLSGQAKKTSLSIEEFIKIKEEDFTLTQLRDSYRDLIIETLLHLQFVAEKGYNKIKRNQEKFKKTDFRETILKNCTQFREQPEMVTTLDDIMPHPVQKRTKGFNLKSGELISQYWSQSSTSQLNFAVNMAAYLEREEIKLHSHPHQKKALLKSSQFLSKTGFLSMTTGSGKTRVEILLANYLISQQPNGMVYIVTATIQLADQLYKDAQETLELIGDARAIEFKNIIVVHSKLYGVQAKTLFVNEILAQKPNVYIFCCDSYIRFMNQLTDEKIKNHRIPIVTLLDEFHLYQELTKELMKTQLPILGFSATPIIESKPIIYTFSRVESLKTGITVPLIIDRLPYSLRGNANNKSQKLSNLLKFHHHACGGALINYKGIIFVTTVEESVAIANGINRNLNSAVALALHSRIENNKEIVDNFRNKPWKSTAILVVVNMLKTGYDDKDCGWCLFGKNHNSNLITTRQMIGRILRTNPAIPQKIAYVLIDSETEYEDFETYKDDEAILQAHPDYFSANHEVIYSELLHAINKSLEFKPFKPLFVHNKLGCNSLSKHLQLLLVAIILKNTEWTSAMMTHNNELEKIWVDPKKQSFNLLNLFLNQVIGLSLSKAEESKKSQLFSAVQFEELLAKLCEHNFELLQKLITSNKSFIMQQLAIIDNGQGESQYTKIFRRIVKKVNEKEKESRFNHSTQRNLFWGSSQGKPSLWAPYQHITLNSDL